MADKCFICNNSNTIITGVEKGKDCQCPHCGNYKYFSDSGFVDELDKDYREKLSSYVFYHKKHLGKGFYIGDFEDDVSPYPHITKEMVESWYPERFADKVDLILLKLYEISRYDGAPISISNEILFLKNITPTYTGSNSDIDFQRNFVLGFLLQYGYIDKHGPFMHVLSPKALERIYELQKNQVHNKKVFVAMKFGDKTKELREKIKEGLIGYDVRIMDEIEHNHQIVPEMLKEIKDSRFVVADLSHHNNGAYYEAGYALGLGKEVIHICAKSKLKSGLHFDVAQVNTLVYDSIDDIPRLLKKRIEATIL